MKAEYEDLNVKEDGQMVCNWCRRHRPVFHCQELIGLFVVTLLSVGLAVMVLGFIIPRDYRFDPSLPAREMERVELHYAQLSFRLDVCIVAGMGLITLGGVIVASLAVYNIFRGAEEKVYRQNDRQDLNLLEAENIQTSTYGSASGESGKGNE